MRLAKALVYHVWVFPINLSGRTIKPVPGSSAINSGNDCTIFGGQKRDIEEPFDVFCCFEAVGAGDGGSLSNELLASTGRFPLV